MTTIVLADHDNAVLDGSTARTVGAALQLGAPVHVLVAGSKCAAVAAQAAKLHGVEAVLLADDPGLEHQMAEPLSALLVGLADNYKAILAASSSTGKDVLPRTAALLDVMQVSDIIKVVAPDTFERPIYAGNAIETVQNLEACKVITVRTSAFDPVGNDGDARIETLAASIGPAQARFESENLSMADRPELTAARIIVSGGRALGSAERFEEVIGSLADKLGAAVGASRAAVDSGYAPNDLQVGQTGKIVAPELYIAIGISGAIQHLAGMKESKIIVAINKDADAPIFQIADYGLVGDLFEIVDAFKAALDSRAA